MRPPVLAAGAMALSLVVVLSNALRLRHLRPEMVEKAEVLRGAPALTPAQ